MVIFELSLFDYLEEVLRFDLANPRPAPSYHRRVDRLRRMLGQH